MEPVLNITLSITMNILFGLYKDRNELAGQITIGLSALLHYFLNYSEENLCFVYRKTEIGVVIPAKYAAKTRENRSASEIFNEELVEKEVKGYPLRN